MSSRNAWLTPDTIPLGERVKYIRFPDGLDWYAVLKGAFYLLTQEENWEEFGALTPEEVAEKWTYIFNDFLDNDEVLPAGIVKAYIAATAPSGWLKCDGSYISEEDYPTLWGLLGTQFGPEVNGERALPNLNGRFIFGNTSTPFLGFMAGEMEVTLSLDEIPSHTHTQNAHTHTQNAHTHTQNAHTHIQNSHNHTQNWFVTSGGTGWEGGGTQWIPTANQPGVSTVTPTNQNATATNQNATAVNQNATAVNQNAGGDLPHNNMPPYITLNYIIKT